MLEFLTGEKSYTDVAGARAIENDSIVRYIILEKSVSSKGIKLLQEDKAKGRELEESTGVASYNIDNIEENIKNCGIEYKIALTHVFNNVTQEFESLLVNDNTLPDFNVVGSVEQLSLSRLIKELQSGNHKSNAFYFKGGQPEQKNLRVMTFPFFPYPLHDPEKEKNRLDTMNKLKVGYANLSDELAEISNNTALGLRLMLHKVNKDNKVVYYPPEKGMIGYGKYYSKNGFYFNTTAFGYNSLLGKDEIYVEGYQCILPDEDNVKLADSLYSQFNEKLENKRLEKLKEESNILDTSVEEEDLF